jgi:Mu transposase-like protein
MLNEKWIEARELELMGISPATIYYHTQTRRDWASKMSERTGRNAPRKLIEIASLPRDLQLRIAKRSEQSAQTTEQVKEPENALAKALLRFPTDERQAWMTEVNRLAAIIERYDRTSPKRIRQSETYAPAPAVVALSNEAACTDKTILAREPRRATPPSQSSLDRWLVDYRKNRGVCFLRTGRKAERADDKRKAVMSPDAMEWANAHWRDFRGPRHLYKAIEKQSAKKKWAIPSEAWFVRHWKGLPQIVLTYHLHGEKEYTSRWAPYVPRTVADLDALQVLCGDHSERDVTVLLRDGRTAARPWLTLWQDIRTGLLWGWHLDTVPSSCTINAAYANGVRTFGAQPLARPDDGYFSYIYTDQGRDYKSHHIDGSVDVHHAAGKTDGRFELLLRERDTGLLANMEIKQILARGYNAKEKPVERTHRDISDWEENTFEEWCGRDAKNKPDRWRDLWHQHQRFLKDKRSASPFIGFEEYREALGGWIHEYNTSAHTRTTLNNARIVPIDEYRSLYTTHYEVSDEALALMLMKSEEREIRKLGVEIFGSHYLHPAMTPWKGSKMKVEVLHDDADYSRVWVILPDRSICEAEMVERSTIRNPNKGTLKRVAVQKAFERKTIKDASLLNFSMIRGETTEDRVAAKLQQEDELVEAIAAEGGGGGTVHRLTRMDGRKLRAVTQTSVGMTDVQADDSIFESSGSGMGRVREFDYDE